MEAIQIGNNVNISSLPDEMLVYIFSLLKGVDVRACRIVSKRWKSCCEAKTITETEKFVFRSPIYQNSEINDFLVNIERSRINVEFDSVDLAALNFEKFGGKIEVLRVINCFFQDESILKNLFITTPNMTSLSIIWSDDDFYNSLSEFEIISKKVIDGLLQEENFQNTNLKEFQYDDGIGNSSEPPPMEYHPFTISHMFSIFPSIEYFSLGRMWNISLVDAELRNVLPKTNITCISNSCVLSSNLGQWESFAYLSKLEILNFYFRDPLLSVNLCKKLFSQVTGLKILSVTTVELGKMLLIEILTMCLKLKELTFFSIEEVCLNTRDEIKLVCTSILRLQKVTLKTVIRVKLDSEKPDLITSDVEDFLKEMYYTDYESWRPLDLQIHHMLLNTCRQLTTLHLHTEAEAFCSNHNINITKILQTQKYLKSLTIKVRSIRIEGSQVNLNRVLLSKHESLEFLEIRFGRDNVCQCLRVVMEWLSTWEFPNLQTLVLCGYDYHYPTEYSQSVSDEFRKLYSECFTKMSTLTRIDLRSNFLKFEDCEKICSQMRGLETITWTEDPGEPQKIVNLFLKLPNLRLVVLDDLQVEHGIGIDTTMYQYFYCRSNKKLFKYRSPFLEYGVSAEWYLSKLDTDKGFFGEWYLLKSGALEKST